MVIAPTSSDTTKQDPLLREDLQKSLSHSHIDPLSLSTFQRILLTTDGTVTHMLEAYLFEQIQVVKLSEQLISVSQDIEPMELIKGTDVIVRKIFLRGRISRRNFIYAESIVVPERLNENFRKELLETKTPIGKIWLEQRVETFKEIIDSGKEPANDLADDFKISPQESILFRTYCVFTSQKPTMMITEKFPESFFRKDF
jgi:chorismate-pyruvate lyase